MAVGLPGNHFKKMNRKIKLGGRIIGNNFTPFIIAEIGINHEGDFNKAIMMIDDAYKAGCECVKFQCHIIEDEMIPTDIIPENANESIWDIMARCALTEDEEIKLKQYVESKNMIFLSTPFSRAAANRLQEMGVKAFKIGSGECNNYPLIEHIASFNKPIILSTGMNDINSIRPAVEIIRDANIEFALLHCTSMYPTPYSFVRLRALNELQIEFPDAILGLSDHSIGNYTSFAAVALGANIIEKHFVSDKNWVGPDVPISITPIELEDLIKGSNAIFKSIGGEKIVLKEEGPTIDFAYSSVVSISNIRAGEKFSNKNIWVKRPGTGEILATDFQKVLGKKSRLDIQKNVQIKWSDIRN